MSSPRASGRAFLGLIRHVKERYGAPEFGACLDTMPEVTRAAFQRRILHAHWYPYEAYAGFLTGLERRFGEGQPDFCRQLGRQSGQRDISTVFRVYLALASTERLIRGCTKVRASYYEQAGSMEATSWAPDDTCLRISGFPAMSPQHCQLMAGWMISTMDALGVEVSADASETKCCSRGDEVHEFRCTWRKR